MSQEFHIHDYSDIVDMPYPPPRTRPKMSMIDRGAQFSPFAALTGYEDAVEETARLTERETVLTEESKTMLDAKLRMIAEHLEDLPEVVITHFVPDAKKAGGAYVVTVGTVREIDRLGGFLILMNRQKIAIEHIRDISGNMF